MINHHLSDATLIAYASGNLPPHFEIIIECHLEQCSKCQHRLDLAEAVGGTYLEQLQPMACATSSLESVLDEIKGIDSKKIKSHSNRYSTKGNVGNDFAINSTAPKIPNRLNQILDTDFNNLQWKFLAPGLRSIILPYGPEQDTQGTFQLLKISPGTRIPNHTHAGDELTMVLQGSYSDEVGRFKPGDIADLDESITHQPIADTEQECICLIATESPIKFTSFIPRVLQQLIHI